MAKKNPIEFALFAPYNETVDILADFLDWVPKPLTKGQDGWWRGTFELEDGDYLYKFRVKSLSYFAEDQLLEVFDPYALQVTQDEKENSIIRVRNGQRAWTDYQWKHDDVPLPVNQDLIIYELFVSDFDHEGDRKGTFRNVMKKLDYLRDLGINCIELMPVKEFPGDGWGYSLRSLFAVEGTYGTPEELCELIDEAHARGMRVVIDGVYNHAEAESPLTKIDYQYWYYRENPDPPELQWGPKFDFGKYDEKYDVFPARKYVIDSIKFWVEKFHMDGIRFDATRAIGKFDVMKEFTDAAFEMVGGRKPFFTVAEHVAEDPAITGYPEGPMVAAWHFALAAHLRAVLIDKENDGQKPDDFDGLLAKLDPAKNGYHSGNRYVNYITSHDHDRIMHQLADQGHIFDEAAFRRLKLGLTLLMTIPGIPMIWMGQEFGFSSDKSLDPRPLDWGLLKNENNAGLLEHVKAVTWLRKKTDALRNDSFEVLFGDPERRVFAYKRWTEGGNVVVVAVNLRDTDAGEFVIEGKALEDGDWHEFTRNYDVKVESGVLKDTLGKSEVKVFIKK